MITQGKVTRKQKRRRKWRRVQCFPLNNQNQTSSGGVGKMQTVDNILYFVSRQNWTKPPGHFSPRNTFPGSKPSRKPAVPSGPCRAAGGSSASLAVSWRKGNRVGQSWRRWSRSWRYLYCDSCFVVEPPNIVLSQSFQTLCFVRTQFMCITCYLTTVDDIGLTAHIVFIYTCATGFVLDTVPLNAVRILHYSVGYLSKIY